MIIFDNQIKSWRKLMETKNPLKKGFFFGGIRVPGARLELAQNKFRIVDYKK
jgi:hypothetical protein